MSTHQPSTHRPRPLAFVALLLLSSVATAAFAQTKKPAPAPRAAVKAPAAAAKTSASKSGASTATHAGPTTAAHPGPTTAAHSSPTTAGRPTAAAAGPHAGMAGRPAPANVHETRSPNGSLVRTRANGSRSDIHDSHRNMDVHRNLDGNRRVMVERPDHSRVFAERGGRGYVQHPYMYHGREFGHRTYYDHGRYYDRYYGRYGYRGEYLDVYSPARYYPSGFYGWAYNPWSRPISYGWGWGGSPWYGYYGSYYSPYAVYPSASFWLTDYLISSSLQAAYAAQTDPGPPPPPGTPAMTPEVKAMIATEVQRQVALENSEAQANASHQEIDPAGSSIARMLGDGQSHVFVVGSDLDLVATDGSECPVSQGDVLQVVSAPPPDATAATAVVISSKGWRKECASSTGVSIAFTDLQDMQNHMRETIDTGMTDLQAKQGSGGLPPAPPSARAAAVPADFAASAPPPDTTAAAEITQQSQAADQAEQDAGGTVPAPPSGPSAQSAPPPPPPATATIAIGQTFDQVTAGLGAPTRIIDLGTKKIYVYPDIKVTFKSGRVSDVE